MARQGGLAQADGFGWIAVQFLEDGFGLAPGSLSAALHPAGEETAGANAVVGVDVGRVIAVPVGDPPSDVTVLRQWGQASAEAIGREQTLAQLEGVAMG